MVKKFVGPRVGMMEFQRIATGELEAFFVAWREKHWADRSLDPEVMPELEWWNELLHYFGGKGLRDRSKKSIAPEDCADCGKPIKGKPIYFMGTSARCEACHEKRMLDQ